MIVHVYNTGNLDTSLTHVHTSIYVLQVWKNRQNLLLKRV